MAWDELVHFARDRRLSYRLHLGLSYLRQRFDARVPAPVLAELGRVGLSALERIENSVVLRDRRPLYASPLGNLWIIFAEYCRYARRSNGADFLIGFSHYLRFRWKLRGRLEIPGVVWRGLAKRFRGDFAAPHPSVADSPEVVMLTPTSPPSGGHRDGRLS